MTPRQSAVEWRKRGFWPVPISLKAKRPILDGWPALRLTEDQIPDYFHDNVNVGILFGEKDGDCHADVDLDSLPAVVAARRLLPSTGIIYGREGKPASHYVYILFPAIRTRQYRDPLEDGSMLAELRCRTKKDTCSQSVAPYSIHPSGQLIRFEPNTNGQPTTLRGDDLNKAVAAVAAAAELAKHWPPNERHVCEMALAGALVRAKWNLEDAIRFVLATYEAVPTHDPQALDRVEASVRDSFEGFKAGQETTGFTSLKKYIDPRAVEAAFKWLDIATEESVAVIPAGEPWRSQLLCAPNSSIPLAIEDNVAIVLSSDEGWAGTIGYNELACKAEFIKDPPAHSECKVGPIEDHHHLWMLRYFQRVGYPHIGKQTVVDGLYSLAMEKDRRFHPIRDYLNNLPPWDQVPRLDKWLHLYFGAKDDDIQRIIAPKFLTTMVARVFEPGCQADYALVLESPQGERKSTTLRDGLMPNAKWFTDQLPNLDSKDAAIQLQGIWLVEAAEMNAMSKAEVNTIKQFLTIKTDRFRPPYGRTAQDFDRQSVFVCTTNEEIYLKDATGDRRFWPIKVGSWGLGKDKINLAALQQNRAQLWAEALLRYREKGSRFPTPEEEVLLNIEQVARYDAPAWTDPVMRWCDNPQATAMGWDEDQKQEVLKSIISTYKQVNLAEVLEHSLRKPIGTWTPRDEREVARILQSKKWRRTQVRFGDKDRRWMYVRPDDGTPPPAPNKSKPAQQADMDLVEVPPPGDEDVPAPKEAQL